MPDLPENIRSVPIPPRQAYSAAQTRRQPGNGIDYVLQYIHRKNYDLRIGTGNAFGAQAQDPRAFAAKIRREQFYSWDFISAGEILQPDRVTPNDTFAKVRAAMQDVVSLLKANFSRRI